MFSYLFSSLQIQQMDLCFGSPSYQNQNCVRLNTGLIKDVEEKKNQT